MDIAHVTGIVEAASPSKWPAQAIAQKIVTILEKTLSPYREGDSPDLRYALTSRPLQSSDPRIQAIQERPGRGRSDQ